MTTKIYYRAALSNIFVTFFMYNPKKNFHLFMGRDLVKRIEIPLTVSSFKKKFVSRRVINLKFVL